MSVASPWAAAGAAEIVARGPAQCPDAAELGFRVERNIGVPLAEAPALRFSVTMERASSGYAARLQVSSQTGAEVKQRELRGDDCTALADAVVVALTLALGAAASATKTSAPSTPLELPPDTTSLPATSLAADEPPGGSVDGEPPGKEAAAATPLRPSLSLAALVDTSSLPETGLGAALGVELSWQRLQLRALATLLFEQHTQLAGGPGRAPGADLQLFAGSLLGCTTALGTAGPGLTAPVCLGLELGRLSGTGTGVLSPRSGSALWVAPRVDGGALWCLSGGPLCFSVALTAAAPILRSRFALNEIGTVYRPPAVVGRLSLGIGVGFD